jgi:NAD(P)H-hydrate epimerase
VRLYRDNIASLAVESAMVKEMDRRTIEEFGVPGIILMEHAAQAVVEVALEMLGKKRKVAVLAGVGNNAGDGFAAARLLSNLGRVVDIFIADDEGKYAGDARTNFEAAKKNHLPVQQWSAGAPPFVASADLIIDALLGTGLSGPLREPFGAIVEEINALATPVLAVDLPSGLDADTGEVATAAVGADKTVTFALPKDGLFRGEGPRLCGEVILADIEMPRDVYPAGRLPGGR